MPNKNCGNCNFQGNSNQKRIYCFYWQKLKNISDSCDKWQEFGEQNRDIRQRLAVEQMRRDKELQKNGVRTLNNSLFGNLLLEKEQKELLCTIVEASRNVPPDKRQEFSVSRTNRAAFLQHAGLHNEEIKFIPSDLGILIEYGLIQVTGHNQLGDVSVFNVHPKGFHYCKYLKEQSGEPIKNIEKRIRNYMDAHAFQKEFSKAYEKWSEAEGLIWEPETSKQLTKIGHLCREAIQKFIDTLYTQANQPGEPIPEAETKNRLGKIIEVKSKELGKTERKFLKGLYKYWDVTNDLIQKQEHGAKKENLQLVWKDGRRVVFQTMMLMYEVSQSLK